eukprot:1704567-Ditylum_brightwellii.AAC.1
MSSMNHLIAMIYYMGFVHLPYIRDYWSTKHYMLHHRVMKELGMTRDYPLFMWHNFHVYDKEDMNMQAEQKEEAANKDYDSEDDGILEFAMDHDQEDQDGNAASDEKCSIKEEEKYGGYKEGSPSGKKI